MIPKEDNDDMLFLARVLAAANELAKVDDTQILRALANPRILTASMLTVAMGDNTVDQLRAALNIIAFTIQELRKVLPKQEEIDRRNQVLLSILPDKMRQEIEKITMDIFKNAGDNETEKE